MEEYVCSCFQTVLIICFLVPLSLSLRAPVFLVVYAISSTWHIDIHIQQWQVYLSFPHLLYNVFVLNIPWKRAIKESLSLILIFKKKEKKSRSKLIVINYYQPRGLEIYLAGGGAQTQIKARWRWGESSESQDSVSKPEVMWMCLMMVTNGGNMARKLSRTAFILGTYVILLAFFLYLVVNELMFI